MKTMYKGLVNSPETTITNNIGTNDTIIYVLDPARVPSDLPNLMVLGTGTNAETIKVTAIEDNALTVERGFQGIAKDWLAGTIIARNFTEYDYAALVDNINELELTKETPDGAQAKADTAEGNAKTYSSNLIGVLSNLKTTVKDKIVSAINELFDNLASHSANSAPHPEANFATKNYVQSNTMFIFPQSSHISDANLDLTDGIYTVGATLKNGPYAETIGDNQGMLIVIRWQFNLDFRIQIHVSVYNGSIYVRAYTPNSLGEWTPWRKAIDSGVLMFGNGSPEGVVTAPVGTLYRRTDGGASSTLYVKESGTGNTGWKAVQTI